MISLSQVIEHVPDPVALLRLIRDRLRPDGRVVLAFPNTGSLNKRISGRKWVNWHIPYHLHHYSSASFAKIAKQAGYRVASSRTVTPNVWTLLQLRAFAKTSREGQASAAWAQSEASGSTPSPAARSGKNQLVSHAVRIVNAVVTPFNRAADAMGLGDSLLVELVRA